jgi:hypothetical protein
MLFELARDSCADSDASIERDRGGELLLCPLWLQVGHDLVTHDLGCIPIRKDWDFIVERTLCPHDPEAKFRLAMGRTHPALAAQVDQEMLRRFPRLFHRSPSLECGSGPHEMSPLGYTLSNSRFLRNDLTIYKTLIRLPTPGRGLYPVYSLTSGTSSWPGAHISDGGFPAMPNYKTKIRRAVLVIVAAVIAVPMYAGSAVIGSVAGAKDATVGGQALVPSTTLFSGDSLQVKEGVAVIAMGEGSRMVFGHQTQASFLRVGMKVKAGRVEVTPVKGFKTLGEVAMLNGAVVVTAREGKLKVEGNGPAMEVAKGKTVTLKAAGAASPAPQAGAAGAPVSGMTVGEVAAVAGAAAAGVGAGFSIAARSKASDAVSAADAAKASADASAAAAKAACQAVSSPTVPAACQ